MNVIRSRENPRVKAWARLAAEPRERRKRRVAVIEGIHLVETFLQQGGTPVSLIVGETAMARKEVCRLVDQAGVEAAVLSDKVFSLIADTETPAGIAAEIRIPQATIDPGSSTGCVFLDGLQNAGNLGTILRTAAAFGIQDVLVGRGCADPWSPKALRAGMGGHFFLRVAVCQNLAEEVARFGGITVCTAAHGGVPLESIDLRGNVGWVFGREAAGVSEAVAQAASLKATIETPGGAESLNVAASAAICLYERLRQLNTHGARS